eukprot:CAMPEP_0185572068 /NCGR_PEP_ID=MMETSP0434-20130131/4047_1 /TAXON_ID=626734 ORGANISM="Favella taraikaensis, Strain Fe Narragansett Bay" /NCGR_SAMPLE_ID=MMETSP0434 /ASSEMBLY_ACC=CAM_ASM_000379 /LENGTH=32 /DNA_ID= /DNA_START= /DNA_END= /DNA_ORIENTATION=
MAALVSLMASLEGGPAVEMAAAAAAAARLRDG